MFWIFVVITTITILASYKEHRNWINPYNTLSLPYLFVVITNKLYGEKVGFYQISDKTLGVVLLGIVMFWLGTHFVLMLFLNSYNSYVQPEYSEIEANYNMKGMYIYIMIVCLFGYARLLFLIRTVGVMGLIRNDGLFIRGPIGHIILSGYPLAPILFVSWLKKHDNRKYLVGAFLYIGLLFFSFVKYHIIGIIVVLFLFAVSHERKYFRPGVILVSLFSTGFFFLNYIVTFFVSNVLHIVNRTFYLEHLWGYISGALINSNTWVNGFSAETCSVLYKLISTMFVLPNMFITTIFGSAVFPIKTRFTMSVISQRYETSNVVDAISTFFPSNNDIIEVILFVIVFFFMGVFFERSFIKRRNRRNRFQIQSAIIMTFFLFFSFFGTFYINPLPWEIVVYSFLIVGIFDHRYRIRIRR